MIHSGSRHLGLEVAGYYQEQAYKSLNGNTKKDIKAMIQSYKAAGREKEIQAEIKRMNAQLKTMVPRELAYCSGSLREGRSGNCGGKPGCDGRLYS